MTKERNLYQANIIDAILLIRGQKVILDFDLARLYGVETKVLNQAVTRNLKRFPEDFMFQLTRVELENWRSHFVTSNPASKMGLRRKPYAFTEQGIAMLSSVLRSERAIQVNVAIMRAFVQMRQMLLAHSELSQKIKELEGKLGKHDKEIAVIFNAIKELMLPPQPPKKQQIGFR